MHIVTCGQPFIDIDGYAGCVAFAELLRQQGAQALAVTTSPPNASITPTLLGWHAEIAREYTSTPDDTFTIIDNSDPRFFDKCVSLERVERVIDHHLGFEKEWQHMGDKAHLEFLGAACTLVCEYWQRAGLLSSISKTSAGLLMCGILDNTLYFGAKITTTRDKKAYAALQKYAKLPDNWPALYFGECQRTILADFASSLTNDTKVVTYPSRIEPIKVGQLALWDTEGVLQAQQEAIHTVLADMPHWYLNLISIGEGSSYFLCEDDETRQWLGGLLGLTWQGDTAKADRMWLRKEIMQAALAA